MSAALTTNVDQRLLRTTKFPPEFNVKVDMKKVNIQLIKAWVAEEIPRILKSEDDVVADLISNILGESRYPNIKELQISLTGFLDKDAASFCATLWKLCISAQNSPHGVPKELLEAKKAELAQAKAEEDRAREEATKRQEAEREREQELARVRERERSDRARGRGGRGGRDFDRRPLRDSRSPPRRPYDDDDYRRPPPRADTYVPSRARPNDRPPPPRRPSPSYGRYASRSRSPPLRRRRREPSLSRSPPARRRRRSSSERSFDRKRDRRSGGDDRRRDHSPAHRRRSPSPRRNRRNSPPPSNRSRSPPPKRTRRASPSPARPSTSESRSSTTPQKSPVQSKKKANLAPDDLMSTNRRKESYRHDNRRLSRETTSPSVSRSETPLTDDRSRRGSSVSKTAAGAEVGEQSVSGVQYLARQQHLANQLHEKNLKQQLLARRTLNRRDSAIGK